MIIEKSKLRIICKKILDFIDEKTEINEDSYWLIGSDVWTKFSEDPSADVGSLNDDWHYLNQIIEEEDRIVSSSDLDRLSSILRAVSQEINPI